MDCCGLAAFHLLGVGHYVHSGCRRKCCVDEYLPLVASFLASQLTHSLSLSHTNIHTHPDETNGELIHWDKSGI